MADIKVLFWFDVEDYINPESEEALLGLLELLDKRGITGIFKLVGEKARVLARHGRSDILDRLERHEIGYHTDWHSVHPVVTEYLEPLGFREGAEAFERIEGGGFRDVQRITGRAAGCYGQPGLAWAPQPYAALNRWGVRAYLDSHDQIALEGRPFWYGGLLIGIALTRPVAKAVVAAAAEHGLVINAPNDDTIRVVPPLTIGDIEVVEFLALLAASLRTVQDALLLDGSPHPASPSEVPA